MTSMNEDRFWQIFFEIYEDLPRQGPGNKTSTHKAFALLADLVAEPRILDIGCGLRSTTTNHFWTSSMKRLPNKVWLIKLELSRQI